MSPLAITFHATARCEIVPTISSRRRRRTPGPVRETYDDTAEVRLSRRRKRQWKADAAALGVTLSDYIRAKVDGAPLRIVWLADPRLLAELGRQGNNFNQCLHGAHAGWPIDRARTHRTMGLLGLIYERLLGEFLPVGGGGAGRR